MSFFDKIYDIAHTDLFKYVFHSGRDKVFVANVSKISTFNEKHSMSTLRHSPVLLGLLYSQGVKGAETEIIEGTIPA